MFLTRMALDVNRPEAAALIVSPGLMNLTVRLMFAGGNLHPLYRLDQIGSRVWLVLLSHLRPEMLAAHARYGYPGVFPSWETFDYEDTLQTVAEGSVLHFELSASPFDVPEDGQLPPAEAAEEWLASQGAGSGFDLIREQLTGYGQLSAEDEQFSVGRWSGKLRVTDQERFLYALHTGIGLHRSDFGQGLMTVSTSRTIWD